MVNMKTLERKFEFMNVCNHPSAYRWANEVISEIENNDLLVFDPTDDGALDNIRDTDGAYLLLDRAKVPVKINEWLAVGCQCLRFFNIDIDDMDEDKECIAYYIHNAAKVICPRCIDIDPQGPAAFLGEIVISNEILTSLLNNDYSEEKFKCIIAHELVHVFDYMRWLVPAFMDWPGFYEHVLNEGSRNDILARQLETLSSFIDSYGEQLELDRMKAYWPSQAEIWFNAFRKE